MKKIFFFIVLVVLMTSSLVGAESDLQILGNPYLYIMSKLELLGEDIPEESIEEESVGESEPVMVLSQTVDEGGDSVPANNKPNVNITVLPPRGQSRGGGGGGGSGSSSSSSATSSSEADKPKGDPVSECLDAGFDYFVAKWECEGNNWKEDGTIYPGTSVSGTCALANWDVGDSGADGIVNKAATLREAINGTSGTALQLEGHDISHITFCGYEDICIPEEEEVCDGIDNDCDGEIDEELVRDCSNECFSGEEICAAGVWDTCSADPVPEGYGDLCTSDPNSCGDTNPGLIDCNGVCDAVTPDERTDWNNQCTSDANSCGDTNDGLTDCDGVCDAAIPDERTDWNNQCTSDENNCGDTNDGLTDCDGVCDATTPDERTDWNNQCTSDANFCGDTNDGLTDCDGVCDATTPDEREGYGTACGNVCFNDGTIGCEGTCEGATPLPENYGEECSVGEGSCESTGTIGCDGICDAIPREPSEEVCDGVDNDCDGCVDEFIQESCGSGVCEGYKTCLFGQMTECSTEGIDAGTCALCDSEGEIVYDKTQDNDCESQKCPDGCDQSPDGISYTFDFADDVDNECAGIGECLYDSESSDECQYQHFCAHYCGAECYDDSDCDTGQCDTNSCTCTGSDCGDGVAEGDEECDDGVNNGVPCEPPYNGECTYCSETCEEETITDGVCGDDIVDTPDEECDDGQYNSDVEPDACRTDCTLPICGDGVVDDGEACEDDADCDDQDINTIDTCVENCICEHECTAELDIMLVIDISTSMLIPENGGTRLDNAQSAANTFIGLLDTSTDQVGLASFSTEATLNRGLTFAHSSVTSAVNGLSIPEPPPTMRTNIGEGIKKAQDEIDDDGRDYPFIILLSDGAPNEWGDPHTACVPYSGTSTDCTDYAVDQATLAKDDGTEIFVIGLGVNTVTEDFLKEIATDPDDNYFSAADSGDLEEIYGQISGEICPS